MLTEVPKGVGTECFSCPCGRHTAPHSQKAGSLKGSAQTDAAAPQAAHEARCLWGLQHALLKPHILKCTDRPQCWVGSAGSVVLAVRSGDG